MTRQTYCMSTEDDVAALIYTLQNVFNLYIECYRGIHQKKSQCKLNGKVNYSPQSQLVVCICSQADVS